MRRLLLSFVLLITCPVGASAAPPPEPPAERFFDVEALLTTLPPFTADALLFERGTPVGTVSVEVSVNERGRLLTWVERVQQGRGLSAEVMVAKVQHDADGRAVHSEVARDGVTRSWRQLGAGRTELVVRAPGPGADAIYDALVDAGAPLVCDGGLCEVTGLIEGGGVLPDLSLMVLLFGEPPVGAQWEGWALSLLTGEPALTTLQAEDQRLVSGGASGARRVRVSSGGTEWWAVHEDGRLVEMTLPSGRALRPLKGSVQDAWAVLESRAAATRAALGFLLAWQRHGWTAAAEHAQFAEPSVIRDWKIALQDWGAQSGLVGLGDVAAGKQLAARLVQSDVLWAADGWRFLLPGGGGARLALTVSEDGGGVRVSDVQAVVGGPRP